MAEGPPELQAEADDLIETVSRALPDGKLEVVGIEASPGEFPPQFAANGLLAHVSPASADELNWGENEILLVRLKRGALHAKAFGRQLEERRADGSCKRLTSTSMRRLSAAQPVSTSWPYGSWRGVVGLTDPK